jgi:molecular chaperone GrpE
VHRPKTKRTPLEDRHHEPAARAAEDEGPDHSASAGDGGPQPDGASAGLGPRRTAGQFADGPQPVERQQAAETEATIPLEQHQRLLAEFDNYRKRTQAQQERASRLTRDELIEKLLPILDDCDRAQQAARSNPEHFDREGALIILRRFAEALRQEGLEKVEAAPGMAFDPEVHEAVLTIPTASVPEGSIAEVLEPGYRSRDRLLRPAKVAVARAPAPDASPPVEPGS